MTDASARERAARSMAQQIVFLLETCPDWQAVSDSATQMILVALTKADKRGAEEMRERAVLSCKKRSKCAEDKIRSDDDDTFAAYANACEDCAEVVGALSPEANHD